MSIVIGVLIYFLFRCVLSGFYTIEQNVRAVKTSFGRAERLGQAQTLTLPMSESLSVEEKTRYSYPILQMIGPGLHFKMPWERVYKASIATETLNMAYDPESPSSNQGGTVLDAVTRDQLNIGLKGQLRYRVSEQNLYAYFFGIKSPVVHVMGYFVSLLREKIAKYESPKGVSPLVPVGGDPDSEVHISETISINDLRKNLREINERMLKDCMSSEARYGIILDASLITSIEPPQEVESALAAINTAYNNVSSEISVAKASADQTIVLSRRAVEIETLKVQAEVEPLLALTKELKELKRAGPEVLKSFVRSARLRMYQKAKTIVMEN
jgi:regulator of protease activity HflC (stomatin/prohibitin superfamily)